ncbi:MAG: inositol monophosphatase [Anaerolineaceae bacterium]|nr:inositol monophosphatase [Anaerolineaceae bacterium]
MLTKLEAAIQAAGKAGDLLRDRFKTDLVVREKSPANLVTDLDTQSEEIILSALRASFPDISALTEESEKTIGNYNGERWIIDPLDGTTNYIHGYPFFSVSIALESNGKIVLGVVHDPIAGKFYSAEVGQGAYLNGEKIHVSNTTEMKQALVGSGFPYYAWESEDNNSQQWAKMIRKVVSLRCDGSAALDLCMVAAGVLDGFWELDLEAWDLAAGSLIVQEAGGKVTLADGNPFTPYQRSVLASNRKLHDSLLHEIINS